MRIVNYFKSKWIEVPVQFRESFINNRNRYNRKWLQIISGVSIGVFLLYILQYAVRPDPGVPILWRQRYIFTFTAFVVLGTGYIVISLIDFSPFAEYVIDIVYISVLCELMVSLTWIDLHFNLELSAYLIALLLLSTTVWIDFLLYALLTIIMFSSIIAGLAVIGNGVYLTFYGILNLLIYLIVGWLIWFSINGIKVRNFVALKELELRNNEIRENKERLKKEIVERIRAQEEIKKELQEKEIILKEVHHRIKNNINSIRGLLVLQAESTENPEIRAALQDAIGRVTSMRALYENLLLSDEYNKTSVKEYLDGLICDVIKLFGENSNITVEKRIDDFLLDPGKLVSLGIIVNELLTNIMKYAFDGLSGIIKTDVKETEGEVLLSIHDNGKGLPEGFDINETGGFGLMIIKLLSRQLDGSFSIENNKGTLSVLRFNI